MPLFREFVASIFLFSSLTAATHAADSALQFVVLRNGNVLRGTVEKAGDHWRVVSAGTELHVRTAEVDFLCQSIEAAYAEYRTRLAPPLAIGHLQLAAWCVRHEQWEAAKVELAAARQLEPNHPRLTILEQTAAHLQRVAESMPPTPAPLAEKSADAVVQTGLNAAQVTELPEGALEDFTRRVQPILVNNCTTSGCHRVDGPQQFQLNRDLLHGMANRRSTMRNLAATLNLVNVEIPLESDLLALASAAHAGMEIPPLPVHQRELHKRLEEWVLLVSGKDSPEPSAQGAAAQFAAVGAGQSGGVEPTTAATLLENDGKVMPASFDEEALSAASAPKPLRVGVQLKAWMPRDEFDPEIFNRRQANVPEPLPVESAVEK
ncbi:MAG: hypothetical protein WD851_01810 [Pirellulales bacterium]